MRSSSLRSSSLQMVGLTVVLWAMVAHGAPPETLLDDLRGKVVLLDFWASWCEPCRQSFPWMSELQQRHGDSGLVVIAINLDQDRKLAERFLAATPARFRIEYDAEGMLATRFDVTAMPMSIVIDRQGRIRERHKGFREEQRATREQTIVNLLKE